ncbi:hypothetical protein Rleg5DRAFT_2798 [Rhizobium leguminosarum bv. viciae WSM1455]|nr:hypothetical protein Rleg5DRAFT_2798 [Rhizobium leguminosarum bv. viciae WSM1455]
MGEFVTSDNRLGTYLKDRRVRLDPATLGFAGERRRTPGLRREEVAGRANISPTWYTWLPSCCASTRARLMLRGWGISMNSCGAAVLVAASVLMVLSASEASAWGEASKHDKAVKS